MSLIVTLLNGTEEVPLEVFPHENFAAVLQKAKDLIGYDVDIKSLVGEDEASLEDNVYEYFIKYEYAHAEEEQNPEGESILPDEGTEETQSELVHAEDETNGLIKIIEIDDNANGEYSIAPAFHEPAPVDPDAEHEEYEDEEIDDDRIIEPKIKNRITCHFCKWRISTMKDARRFYILEEKNMPDFYRNLSRGTYMTTKLICSRCLSKGYRKIGTDRKELAADEYIVIGDSVKMIYKEVREPEAPPKKSSKIESEEIIVEGDLVYKLVIDKNSRKSKAAADQELKSDFVVRRKMTNRSQDAKNKSKVIKRKLEMDGTISEIVADEVEQKSSDSKRSKLNAGLICRSCGLQLNSLSAVVEHCLIHQVNNRISGLPCILCLRNFKTYGILKRHVFVEHQNYEPYENIGEDGYLDENSGSYIKHEISHASHKDPKKEEFAEEHEAEDYLTDRLQRYLTGELDADAFFQQEYQKTDSADDSLAQGTVDDDDDDDVIVWIVGPNEEEEKSAVSNENSLVEVTPAIIESIEQPSAMEDMKESIIDDTINTDDSKIFEESIEDETITSENIDESVMEGFQEVDYSEDPEYEPEDDNESIKSDDQRRTKRKQWAYPGKYKCEFCNKNYTSKLRLDQHKCSPSSGGEDKKDDLSCSICNETFLSKVRLQFHRQTHKEGGWQQMGCDRCPRKDFASEHELFDHICFTHSKPFHCPYDGCNKTFKLRKLLKSHIRDHGVKKFGCHICGLRFHVHQTLKEHMVLHLKVKPYQCHICQKYMSKASRLRMHLLVHTSQLRPTHVLVCRWCDSAFKDPLEAEAHCENVHDCEPREEDKEGIMNEIAFMEIGNYQWKKKEIDPLYIENEENDAEAIYLSKQNILMQLSDEARNSIMAVWIDKVYSCQYCEKVYYTKEALHQHRQMHYGISEPYQCHLCEARFLTYARCTAHKSTHGYFKEGGAPSLRDFPVIKHYLCDICDKSNLLWTTVSVHYRHHHKHASKQHPLPCKSCSLQFPNSWDLGKHRRMKHRREVYDSSKAPIKVVNFSYKCTDCDQELPTKSALTSHRKVAHGEGDPSKRGVKTPSVLVCSECGKTYATKPALLTHIKWHTEHGIGKDAVRRRKRAFGKGSHICSICGLGFYSAANLRAHIDRIHEKTYKFTCEQCGKGHFTHMEMETHKLTHTGERPFKCPDCPRAYVTKAILNKHYRNHTGERPYSCNLCGATFKTAHSRNYHKMKHENGKLPSPLIVLEVKGGSKKLQAALHAASFQDKKGRSSKHMPEVRDYIKEELEEFQEVNEEEVLIRTSEVDEEMEDSLISVHEETSNGVHIVYKRARSTDENGCENEYTVEYEEDP